MNQGWIKLISWCLSLEGCLSKLKMYVKHSSLSAFFCVLQFPGRGLPTYTVGQLSYWLILPCIYPCVTTKLPWMQTVDRHGTDLHVQYV